MSTFDQIRCKNILHILLRLELQWSPCQETNNLTCSLASPKRSLITISLLLSKKITSPRSTSIVKSTSLSLSTTIRNHYHCKKKSLRNLSILPLSITPLLSTRALFLSTALLYLFRARSRCTIILNLRMTLHLSNCSLTCPGTPLNQDIGLCFRKLIFRQKMAWF